MNYVRIYEDFIADRRARDPYAGLSYYGRVTKVKRARKRGERVPYVEHHHIIAKFDGGTNAADNVVALSYREHVFAHLCLAKAHGGKHYAALWAVVGMIATPSMNRSILAVPAARRLLEKNREEMNAAQRGQGNKRSDTVVRTWRNWKTGETVVGTRHALPVPSQSVADYLKGQTNLQGLVGTTPR